MKNVLLSALCFFALQIASCSQAIMEYQPGATKLSIESDFKAQLQNIKWNGSDFGDISPGEGPRERMVSEGQKYVYFTLKGKEYETQTIVSVEKYSHTIFKIHKNLFVSAIDESSKMLTLEEALNKSLKEEQELGEEEESEEEEPEEEETDGAEEETDGAEEEPDAK
ncbi:MAG: hypothetical protein LBH25_09475 [Fibromonadaceae bacterium]|jgi:hypothetical protein|nr:hypothetical protein [Fibromonadaceae bacterium]